MCIRDSPKERSRARELCFNGLGHSPDSLQGRLILARLFYLDGMIEFSIRELVELKRRVDLPSVTALLELYGPHAEPYLRSATKTSEDGDTSTSEEEEVLAEIDLDEDFVVAIEELGD